MYCDPAARKKQGKLNKPWFGPYQVLNKLSDSLYILSMRGKDVLVNTQRLKKYYERSNTKGTGRYVEEEDDSEEISDEEEDDDPPLAVEDEELQAQERPPTDEDLHAPEGLPADEDMLVVDEQPQIPQPAYDERAAGEQVPGNKQCIMGNRGQLWCNLNPNNILDGRRNRHK